MFAALALLAIGLVATDDQPQELQPSVVCSLARTKAWKPGQTYVLRGKFFSDGHHGAMVSLEGCDDTLTPELANEAAAKVANFHNAFHDKCGGFLMNDAFSGVLTGTFERRRVRLFGWRKPMVTPIFVIRDVSSDALDTMKLVCD